MANKSKAKPRNKPRRKEWVVWDGHPPAKYTVEYFSGELESAFLTMAEETGESYDWGEVIKDKHFDTLEKAIEYANERETIGDALDNDYTAKHPELRLIRIVHEGKIVWTRDLTKRRELTSAEIVNIVVPLLQR